MQKRVLPLARARVGGLQDAGQRGKRLALQAGLVVGALGAVGAVLAASAGLDAHEGAELDLVPGPVGAVGLAGLRDKVEEGQFVEDAEGAQVVSHEGVTLARKGCLRQAGRPWEVVA